MIIAERALEHYKAIREAEAGINTDLDEIRDAAIRALIRDIPTELSGQFCPYCGQWFIGQGTLVNNNYCSRCGQALKNKERSEP